MRRSCVPDVLFWAGVTLAYGAYLLARDPLDVVPLVPVGTLVALGAGAAVVRRDAQLARAGTRWRVLAGAVVLVVAYATAAPAHAAVVVRRFRTQRAQLARVARAAIARTSADASGPGTQFVAAEAPDPAPTGIAAGLRQSGYLDVTVWPEYVVFAESGFLSTQRGVLWVRPGHAAPPLGPAMQRPLGPPAAQTERPSFYYVGALGGGWYRYKAL